MTSTQPPEQPERVYYPEPLPRGAAYYPPAEPDTKLRRATGAHTLTRRVVDADSPPAGVNHPAYAVETLAAAGSVAYLADAAPWWFAAGGAASALVGAVIAHARYRLGAVTAFTAAAAAGAGGVLATLTTYAPWSGPGIAALGAAALAGAPAYAGARRLTRKKLEQEIADAAAGRAEEKRTRWGEILEEAGARNVDVDTSKHDPDEGWVHGERKFPAGFALALRIGPKGPTIRSLTHLSADIERVAANRLNIDVRTGSIEIVPSGFANRAELIVPTQDVMSDVFDIDITDGPLSVNDPLPISRATDGGWLSLSLMDTPHGLISGQTNIGKSNFLHVHTVRLTQCPDDVEWMICGSKPVRNFAAWLQPWLQGYVDRPVLDWIAGDVREACRMLLDAYAAVDRRQEAAAAAGDDKWIPTPEEPRITILIDESIDFLESDLKVTSHRDEEMTFSELVLKLMRIGRSEGISVLCLTQRATATMMGADAGNMKSQIQYRVGMRDTGATDSNAIFTTETSGVDCTQLPAGGMYVEMLGYERPRISKSPRVKPEHQRYAAVHHVRYCGTVDSWTARVFDHYSGRWTRPNQQELLKKICPDSPRIVDGEIADPNVVATAPGTHPGGKPEQQEGEQPEPDTGSPDKPRDEETGEPDEDVIEPGARAEVDMLEAWLANSPDVPDSPDVPEIPEQTRWGAHLDPSFPDETRQLLAVFAASDLRYGEWVTTHELLALAVYQLDWPDSTPGTKQVLRCLRDANVHQPRSRPKRDGHRLASGFWTADLLEAIDTMSNRNP